MRAFYENAETDECLYDIRRAIEELERLYALPVFDSPPTWQEEVAAVEEAFERSGVQPTWPADEAGNIGPMAAAMADEIGRLRVAIHSLAERDATLSVCEGNVTVTMDATPATHATPGEGSVQGEGTLSEPLYRHPLCQDSSQKNFTLTDEERGGC